MAEGNLILSHQLKDPTYDGNTPTEAAWIPLADLYKNNDQVNLYLRAKLDNEVVSANNLTTSAVTSNKIKDGAVITSKIANSAINSDKIQDGAVSGTKITIDAVSTDNLTTSAVTEIKIAPNAVASNKIKNGAVTSNKIKDGAVTRTKIANNSIINPYIATDTITLNKLDTQLKGVFIGLTHPSSVEIFEDTMTIWDHTYIKEPQFDIYITNGTNYPGFEFSLTSRLEYQKSDKTLSLITELSYKIAYWDDENNIQYLEWNSDDTKDYILKQDNINISRISLSLFDEHPPVQIFKEEWIAEEQQIILDNWVSTLESFLGSSNGTYYRIIDDTNYYMTIDRARELGEWIIGKSSLQVGETSNFIYYLPFTYYGNSIWDEIITNLPNNTRYQYLFERYYWDFIWGFTRSGNSYTDWWTNRPEWILTSSIDNYFNTLGLSEADYNKIGLWIEI